MKRIFLILVFLIALALAYILGTFRVKTEINLPDAAWAEGSEAGQAWREYLASQEAASARIFETTDDPLERREGLSFVRDLASLATEMKIQRGSELRPSFTDWMGDFRKVLGDTPDAIYHTAQLSPEYSYEISGNIADAEYLGFALYGRLPNGWNRAAGNMSDRDMQIADNGDFTITLSAAEPDGEGNWIEMSPDVHMVMVRQYFHDRPSKRAAEFDIRNVSEPLLPHMTDAMVAADIRSATKFFNEALNGIFALTEMSLTRPNTDKLPRAYKPEFSGIFYPTKDNQYFGTWYLIEPDEALIIEGVAPTADYWSVSLQNRWMQSLDYENRQISLDNHQIKLDEAGRYRIVISEENPGEANWLDTDGHRQGILAIRYQLADGIETPDIRLVKLSEL